MYAFWLWISYLKYIIPIIISDRGMNKLCFKCRRIDSKDGLHKFFLVHVPILNLIFFTTDMILRDSP